MSICLAPKLLDRLREKHGPAVHPAVGIYARGFSWGTVGAPSNLFGPEGGARDARAGAAASDSGSLERRPSRSILEVASLGNQIDAARVCRFGCLGDGDGGCHALQHPVRPEP